MIARAMAIEGRAVSRNLRRAHCYMVLGMYDEALQAYASELQIDPQNSRINLFMGWANIGLKRFSAAREQLQLVAAEEQGAAYHYLMASVLAALDNKVVAQEHYAEAVALAGGPEAAADSVLRLTVR